MSVVGAMNKVGQVIILLFLTTLVKVRRSRFLVSFSPFRKQCHVTRTQPYPISLRILDFFFIFYLSFFFSFSLTLPFQPFSAILKCSSRAVSNAQQKKPPKERKKKTNRRFIDTNPKPNKPRYLKPD